VYGFVQPEKTLYDIWICKCTRQMDKGKHVSEKNTSFLADLKTYIWFLLGHLDILHFFKKSYILCAAVRRQYSVINIYGFRRTYSQYISMDCINIFVDGLEKKCNVLQSNDSSYSWRAKVFQFFPCSIQSVIFFSTFLLLRC
jgi:hypothetical protein